MGFIIFFNRLDDLKPKIFERIVDRNDIGETFYVNNAFNAAFGDESFAHTARMGSYIQRGAGQFNALLNRPRKEPLFGADAVANLAAGARGDLLNIANAADNIAVIAFMKAVVSCQKHLSAPHGNGRHFGSQAAGFGRDLLEHLEEFSVGGGKRHEGIIA